jgi:hypothetical protein
LANEAIVELLVADFVHFVKFQSDIVIVEGLSCVKFRAADGVDIYFRFQRFTDVENAGLPFQMLINAEAR